jgi:ubiquinone/menaquinone biosynthesis C-methylase UbiE
VEKNQNYYFISIKPAFIAAFIFFFYTVAGQKMQTFKGHCGSFFENMAHLYKIKQSEIDFYQFKPGQTVASIGAGCTHWEAAYAAVTDSVTFYLEDIDTTKLNEQHADFAWNYYAKLRERPMTSNYKLVFGDIKSTSLPENSFDKIIIINSFHEFTYQSEMLDDIKKKLKPGGILYIDEALPKRAGQLHGICNLPMLNNEEMIALFAKNGFEYLTGLEFNYRQKNPVRKIFAFKKIKD